MDLVGIVRAVVVTLVGAFLVIYAAVADIVNRGAVVVVGLVLLGVVSLEGVGMFRNRNDGPP